MQYDELIKVFCQIDDPEVMKKFFEEIFTSSERRDIPLRWKLMKMIHDKVPQRQIASELGISLCKITRGAKILKDPESVTSRILNKEIDSQHVADVRKCN